MIINGNLITQRTYLTEIQLTSVTTGQQFQFNDVPTLRLGNIRLEGLQVFTADQLAVSPNGNTVISAAGSTGLVLTLAEERNDQIIYQIPIYDLISVNNGGLIRLFNSLQINLIKSFVQIMDGTSLNANESVLINWIYTPTGK